IIRTRHTQWTSSRSTNRDDQSNHRHPTSMVSPTLTPGKKAGIGYSVREPQPYLQEPPLRTQQEARIMSYRVTYNDLTIVINSARTQQAACRLAFRYWISNNYIPKQPK